MISALRWPLPELEEPAELRATPEPPSQTAPDAAAEAAATEAEPQPSTGEIAAEQLARGYREGLQQGLDEGRKRGLAEGRETGHAAGYTAGAEAARTAVEAEAQRLTAIAERLAAPIPALEAAVEEAVVALALELARCVIGRETRGSADHLAPLVRQALAKIPIDMGAPQVLLNPIDLEPVRVLAPDLDAFARLVSDETIEPGDCRVVCDGERTVRRDRRWRPRPIAAAQADLSIASRWRAAMQAMFEGEDQ